MPFSRGGQPLVTADNTSAYLVRLSEAGLIYVGFFIVLSGFGAGAGARPTPAGGGMLADGARCS
eukprot:1418362-Prymnesium_polylepis.1